MMDAAAWISIASVCAAGAMSPGPSFAVVVRNTVAGGRIQGVLTGIGHGLGVGVYACGAVFGMAVVMVRNVMECGTCGRTAGVMV